MIALVITIKTNVLLYCPCNDISKQIEFIMRLPNIFIHGIRSCVYARHYTYNYYIIVMRILYNDNNNILY